ncbi:MAG: hypothetical protein R2753_13555 [Chitinophagales bacterium]
MKRSLIIPILLFSFLQSFGGNEFSAKGAAENSTGNHTTTIVNAFSIYNNQAAAAFLENPTIGLAYHSSYFPVNINTIAVAGAAPLSFGTIGGSFEYFGNSLYSEMKLGLAYAMKLGTRASIGVQLDYLNSSAQNYSTQHYITFELGVYYRPIQKVSIGAHIYNPVKWIVDDVSGEILPVVFNVGLSYNPFDQLTILAELEKDIIHPFNFKGGIEYEVVESFSVRAGFNTQPTLFSFGLGYKMRTLLTIDVASNYHLDLGFNTSVSLSFEFKKKDDKQ